MAFKIGESSLSNERAHKKKPSDAPRNHVRGNAAEQQFDTYSGLNLKDDFMKTSDLLITGINDERKILMEGLEQESTQRHAGRLGKSAVVAPSIDLRPDDQATRRHLQPIGERT